MSSGGKLQLAFRGPQDAYISGRPQMTFFKAIYKRYTNFAKECIWCPFDGNPRQGGKSIAIIERQGDLIQEAFITADVTVAIGEIDGGTDSNNLAYAGERLIESVDLYIGQQLIDKHYQRWWRIYSELYHNEANKAQYSKLTSPDSAATCKIYLPLIFFFNRNPGLALPLVSMPNQQVRLTFNWSPDEGIWPFMVTNNNENSVKCWVNYIYLDDEERKVMSDRNQAYLIDQVQYSGLQNISTTAQTATATPQRIPLEFKHPVKEIYMCAPRTADITQRQWNFSQTSLGVNEVSTTTQTEPHLSGGVVRLDNTVSVSESVGGTLRSLSIEINKSKIAEEQGGKYYNSMQPFQYHSGCPVPGLYSYSFATKPESIKPTGSCNFSRIQDAAAHIRFNGTGTDNPNLEIFATNFNVLDIKKGFASLAFVS